MKLGPKSLILPFLKLQQLLLPTEAAGVWVPSLMGVVKALPQVLTLTKLFLLGSCPISQT